MPLPTIKAFWIDSRIRSTEQAINVSRRKRLNVRDSISLHPHAHEETTHQLGLSDSDPSCRAPDDSGALGLLDRALAPAD